MREGRKDAVFWAGSAWLVVAIVGGIISAVFFVFYALIALPFLVLVPLGILSGLWGWRSAIVAWIAAAYSLAPAVGLAALAVGSSNPRALVVGLIVAIPGVLSVFAALELRRANLIRSGRGKPVPPA